MNTMQNAIAIVILSIALVVSSFIFAGRIGQAQKNQAFHDCAQDMSYKTVIENRISDVEIKTTTSTEPITTLYTVCIEDKGYTTDVK